MDRALTAILAGFVWTAVIWLFFFGPRRSATVHTDPGGLQELSVVVQGGYAPDRIVVRAGSPVRLNFKRLETASCSERVIFPDFEISKKLPTNEMTPVEFTPEREGSYTFSCGMGMYQGTLIVEGGSGK